MFATLSSVTLAWPDGRVVFDRLDLTLENKRYGLVGPNGVGKTTLAKLVAGLVDPTAGTVRSGPVVVLDQIEDRPDMSIAEKFFDGESSADPWCDRTAASLLSNLDLSRSCRDLSGGEWMRVRLAHALARGIRNLILDEPTNDLDREGREIVRDFVRNHSGSLLVISHDRELLSEVDEILELSNRGLTVFGGNWEFYDHERTKERSRAKRNLDLAKRERDGAERERNEKIEANARRNRHGEARGPKLGLSRLALGAMKRRAQTSTAKLDVATREAADAAVREASEAFESMKVDPVMYVDALDADLHARETVAIADRLQVAFEGVDRPLWGEAVSFSLRGPGRWALKGPNGSGKSTLLALIAGKPTSANVTSGELVRPKLPFAFLEQDATHLERTDTVMESVMKTSSMNEEVLRNELAKFQFRRESVHQRVATLSGGERLRLALARALLSDPSPRLLILDEPTNNVDVVNVEFLEGYLRLYAGALLVVSHDEVFLKNCGIEDAIVLPARERG